MSVVYYFIRILLVWLLCLFSVLLHELGHALGYRLSGGKAGWKVIVGSGPKMFSIRRFTFCCIPAGGYFYPVEELEPTRKTIMTYAGGPFLSLLQAVLYGIIHFCIPEFVQPGSSLYEILHPASAFLFYFNFFQFLLLSFPCVTGSYAGDLKVTACRSLIF